MEKWNGISMSGDHKFISGAAARTSPGAVASEPGPAMPAKSAAAASDEFTVLRYFRIRKGVFGEFYRVSADKIWPYFEKTGAQIVGMWQVVYPDIPGQKQRESKEYDEVYLLTRYTSMEHWQATRGTERAKLDNSDPLLINLREGLRIRAALSMQQESGGQITVLRGNANALLALNRFSMGNDTE